MKSNKDNINHMATVTSEFKLKNNDNLAEEESKEYSLGKQTYLPRIDPEQTVKVTLVIIFDRIDTSYTNI